MVDTAGVQQDEAREEAKRRNLMLGEQGRSDSFFAEVERSPGVWDVDERTAPPEKTRWWERIFDVIWP